MMHQLLLPGAVLVSATVYLIVARLTTGDLGFPLDDSWIHQTLARNLVSTGQWTINPGEPAAVSTAPLWSLLLAIGYWLSLPPLVWGYVLGALALAWSAWETLRLGRILFPDDELSPWLAALLVATEWHLVWASLAGMETLLFTALSLTLLDLSLRRPSPNPVLWGGVAGLLMMTRPEGVLLAGLVLGWRLWPASDEETGNERARWLVNGAVFAGMVAAALCLNMALSGQPLPSTFYAKHAAYGAGLNLLVYGQFLVQATVELARGPLLLLYPGVLFLLVKGFSRTGRDVWLPLVWVGLLVGAYTLWLPALYQHGRYLVPLMPLLLLYGLNGSRRLVASIPSILLPQVSLALLVLIAAISWGRGMQVFAENVGYINEHQVAMSRWISDNTPPDAAIASHDIGALGYFGHRTLVDMAGLASAELTTTSKDVDRVISILTEKRVSYVLIQPNWYPPLYKGITNLPGVRLLTEGPETQYGAGYRFQVLSVSRE